jgi:branched-chain amino acid transport system ATP-binding protein
LASETGLLHVSGASAHYRRVQSLHDIELDLPAGASLAVLGANGAGKTTLLRAITGVMVRRAGTIRFDGADIAALAPHDIVRRGLAMAPEGKHLFKPLSVAENIEIGALPLHQSRRSNEAAGCRDLVNELFPILAARRTQIAGTLSGGEQQMLAIARALMSKPRLLLLDEPTVGLAPKVNDALFTAFRRLRQIGVGLIIAEQAVRLACDVADEAIVLHLGRIALRGPASEVRDNPELRRLYLGE